MSDRLSDSLWVDVRSKNSALPETKVEEALQKALDNTTPEHAGTPWEAPRKESNLPTEDKIYRELKLFVSTQKSELPMGDSELSD